MEKEHRSKGKFVTPNYGMTTCPADEWRIVMECDTGFEKDYNGQRRRIPSYARLLKADMGKPEGQRAGLTQAEIIAVILYTGPMVCRCDAVPSNEWALSCATPCWQAS